MGKTDLFRADRYRTRARQHAGERSTSYKDSKGDNILPTYNEKTTTNETGGLNSNGDGRGPPSGSTASNSGGGNSAGGGAGNNSGSAETTTNNDVEDPISQSSSSSAPPPDKSEDAGTGDAAMTSTEGDQAKPPMNTRMLAGSKRFIVHMRNAIFHSWVNVLLVFVPIGIVVEAIGLSAGIVFGMNAIAIIPLAGLLSFATESVAIRLGDTLGALLNVSFGNAVELIIFIIALVKNEISIVQASLLGSILANLLLILGMAFLFGGLRYREQVYNSTVTQMSACLLSLSVMSLLLPVCLLSNIWPMATLLTLTHLDCILCFLHKVFCRFGSATGAQSQSWDQCCPASGIRSIPIVPAEVSRLHVREYSARSH